MGRSVYLMWTYEKRLQFPVKITKTCPKTAQLIISQYGGPDGELSASMRYLAQRYTMPVKSVGGLLTDIGTEELAHMEMICAMVYQLTRDLTVEQAQASGFDAYYIDHTKALWPQAAAGVPFTALEFQSKGDAIADLTEDLAAEQKARVVYDNLLRMITDPEVREPLKFLRTREIVHFQRFGEALERTKERLDSNNYYYFNPEFDKKFLQK
nr:manganese catalase family protein [Blautia marasmi]